jgi:DNA (cytosine-5)-methyltransferase 1
MKYYGNGANISSADEPCGTLTTKDRMAMVTTEPVLSNGQFLLNPAWFGDAHSTDKPSPTIVASQHKAPLSIAMCWKGKPVEVQETDCPTLIQIKHFCQAEGIADVSMRMLKVPELLLIQGFPKDYILMGSDAAKKKFIGNSVCPVVATALAVANRKVQLL